MLQFDGCLFYFCSVTNKNPDGSLQDTHPLNILKHQDIREKAVQNTKRLQDKGYEVVRMQECVWKKMKKNPRIASFLASLRTVTPKRQLLFQKILEGIQGESLFQ